LTLLLLPLGAFLVLGVCGLLWGFLSAMGKVFRR